MAKSIFLALFATAATVSAHGHVHDLVVNGVKYMGYRSTDFPYQENPPIVAGWTINAPDNGFVSPDAYNEPDIICHNEAKPGKGHIELTAGDVITLQWSGWPKNHRGPILDYLARCDGPCEKADKNTLKFFKIDGLGMIKKGSPSTFADQIFQDNGDAWNVRIPENIAPGNYVLRHELIALHSALKDNGAQHYPQCFNLKIKGSGSDEPKGYLGTQLYNREDPGILYNVYGGESEYEMPGPAIIEGGVTSVKQNPSKATATATATPAE